MVSGEWAPVVAAGGMVAGVTDASLPGISRKAALVAAGEAGVESGEW